ncbi:uncharacterized protein EV154DRAFT_516348 [Mucor mucedo]|uniref:uncharacterized protein n=1 Tax=Mucor mucedo TaxID=29922 RepID=UPI00221F53DC|nr:uncharacterized protein EV154DRAFT_516348 [Mucor mucedo]KAI7888834.1 hypothetical protein EV154DRAFT_516348 [Mucor mucedo]
MDPIAFFDHLAAKSATSQSTHVQSLSSNEDIEQRMTLRPSLDTPRQDDFQDKWILFVEAYRTEKQELSEHLKDQLVALDQIEQDFDQSNLEIQHQVGRAFDRLSSDLHHHQSRLSIERKQFEREKDMIQQVRQFQDEKIRLNVGGQFFETSLTTLRKDPRSKLAQMFSPDSNVKPEADNSYFIDRDSTYFRLVLNYLRDLKIPAGIVEDPKIMDELMQEARFYELNDLLRLKWENLPVITQEQLYQLYPPFSKTRLYQPIIMRLTGKNLSNLDFSNYHIDPQSNFMESNLENADFSQAKFGFDFDHQVNFTGCFLLGAVFPKEGTANRASGVQMKLDGAIV